MITVIINSQSKGSMHFENEDDLKCYMDELKNHNLITNSIYINGQPVKTNIGKFISDHFNEIHLVEITLTSKEDFNKELAINLSEYLENAILQLEPLSDAFYLNPGRVDWTKLTDLLEAFDYIVRALSTFSIRNNPNSENWEDEIKSINRILNELLSSLEQKDKILIADIILYEVKGIFEQIEGKLNNYITFEVNSNDSN